MTQTQENREKEKRRIRHRHTESVEDRVTGTNTHGEVENET